MTRAVFFLLIVCLGFSLAANEKVLIALKQRNLPQLEKLLIEEISNPLSENYGTYLSAQELGDLIGQSPERISNVVDILVGFGGKDIRVLPTRDYIEVSLPSFTAKKLERNIPLTLKDDVSFIARLAPTHLKVNQFHNGNLFDVHVPSSPQPITFADVNTDHLSLWVVPSDSEEISAISLTFDELNENLRPIPNTERNLITDDLFQCVPCSLLPKLPRKSSFFHQKDFCNLFGGNEETICYMENIPIKAFDGEDITSQKLFGLRVSVKNGDSRWSKEAFVGSFHENDDSIHPIQLLAKEWDPNSQKQEYKLSSTAVASSDATQCVWGSGTYGYSPSDLSKFYSKYSIPSNNSFVVALGENGNSQGDNFVEATLDIEYISAMAPQLQSACINTDNSSNAEGSTGFGNAFLDFTVQVNSMSNPPNVISLSLGSLSWASCNILCTQAQAMGQGTYEQCLNYVQSQFQVCMYDSETQVSQINTELMKMGSRGVSVFAATGDGGNHFSFGPFKPFGPNSALANTLNQISCEYTLPTFPAASQWVTGVGASQMKETLGGSYYPIGCSTSTGGGITGGAAFSWQFPMPSYQQTVVEAYLNKFSSTDFGNFNSSGRAYPDLTGIGSSIPIINNGRTEVVGGTSCSTPEVAGVFSMINDSRMKNGLPAIGFLNPRLYQAAATQASKMFVDITQGSSNCGIGKCCDTGFVASEGWDAFTGFGNILYPGLLETFSN